MIWLPIVLATFTVVALIVVDERVPAGGPRNLRWVAVWKPLSSVLVVAGAAQSFTRPAGSYDTGYSLLVLLGLLLSLAGDVLLIIPFRQSFPAGLAAFLLAQLAYAATFIYLQISRGLGVVWAVEEVAAVVLAVAAWVMYSYLGPHLGKLRAPVVIYMIVISVMLHRAIALLAAVIANPGASSLSPIGAGLACAGALLFYLSDAILAADRFAFGGRLPHSHLWNLSTYYAGQALIALSASFITLSI
jgi:uncharacterized membrane protein YhhN